MTAEVLFDAIREIEDRSGASLNVECSRFEAPFVIEAGSRAAVERAARGLGFSLAERDGSFVLQKRANASRNHA
jgi:hypothetical protein